jgi:hypothetical protein
LIQNEITRREMTLTLFFVFGLEVIAIAIVELPTNLSFLKFGFYDEGSSLTTHYLMTLGYRPTVDFGYPYGLLGLIVNRLLPASPAAYQIAMIFIALSIAYALASIAGALKIGSGGVALLICAMPFAVRGMYWSYSHGLEAALISNALAQQARGKRSIALALAAAAVLAKPTLAYVYGLILIVIIVANHSRARFKLSVIITELIPAAVTATLLGAIIVASFGVTPMMNSLISWRGMALYRYLNHGLLHGAMYLLYFPGVRVGYYAGTVAGFFILGTAALVAAAIIAIYKIARGIECAASLEIAMTCAILHLVFITAMFGGPTSWQYYSYILVVGLAAASCTSKFAARTVWAFALIAALGQKQSAVEIIGAWQNTHRSAALSGLWASSSEEREWLEVRRMAAAQDAVIVSSMGAGFLFAPEVQARKAVYLIPEEAVHSEIQRQADAINRAGMVIIRDDMPVMSPKAVQVIDWSLEIPEISAAVAPFHTSWRGQHFEVRVRDPATSASAPSARLPASPHSSARNEAVYVTNQPLISQAVR